MGEFSIHKIIKGRGNIFGRVHTSNNRIFHSLAASMAPRGQIGSSHHTGPTFCGIHNDIGPINRSIELQIDSHDPRHVAGGILPPLAIRPDDIERVMAGHRPDIIQLPTEQENGLFVDVRVA